LDKSEDEETVQAVKRRKVAKGKGRGVEKDDVKWKKTKSAAKRRSKRGVGSNDDYEDSEDDEYTAPAQGLFSPSKKTVDPSVRPPNGSFEECVQCGKDFTVVCVPKQNGTSPISDMISRVAIHFLPIPDQAGYVTTVQKPLVSILSKNPPLGNEKPLSRGERSSTLRRSNESYRSLPCA
jgi:hypothetical protein